MEMTCPKKKRIRGSLLPKFSCNSLSAMGHSGGIYVSGTPVPVGMK